MELTLFHGQGIFYAIVKVLFIIRLILNYIIYERIDSAVTQPGLSIWSTFKSWSTQEKENLTKSRPDIINVDKDKGGLGRTEIFHIALTFWWPSQIWDGKTTRRLKLIANILNILFLIVLLGAMFFYLHMQEINARYYNITRDWTKVFK